MTPEEMLDHLDDYGRDASSDYHDGLDGWFGWTVDLGHDTLTVRWKPDGEGAEGGDAATSSWRLVPLPNPAEASE